MSRGYVVPSECMVRVRFGLHLTSGNIRGSKPLPLGDGGNGFSQYELGLTAAQGIVITPKFSHKDIKVADYGPSVPADVLATIEEYTIKTRLINYDNGVLNACIQETVGGGEIPVTGNEFPLGAGNFLPSAGSPLGGNIPLYQSGCHFMGLFIDAGDTKFGGVGGDMSVAFLACYLTQAPQPMGTNTSDVELSWRCIPYNPSTKTTSTDVRGGAVTITSVGEIQSSGAIIASPEIT